MTEREKRIEEMSLKACEHFCENCNKNCGAYRACTILYDAGYRKEKEVKKETFDKLTETFMEMTAYGSDSNQHAGYYDYSIKISEVIEIIAEVFGFEYKDYEEHTEVYKHDFENFLKEKFGVEVEE